MLVVTSKGQEAERGLLQGVAVSIQALEIFKHTDYLPPYLGVVGSVLQNHHST